MSQNPGVGQVRRWKAPRRVRGYVESPLPVASRLCYRLMMPLYVALLRAVNVGGRKLAMADLKAMFQALEFTSVQTILQTGNVVFGGSKRTGAALEVYLETETEKRLKLQTACLVRTADEWVAQTRLKCLRPAQAGWCTNGGCRHAASMVSTIFTS